MEAGEDSSAGKPRLTTLGGIQKVRFCPTIPQGRLKKPTTENPESSSSSSNETKIYSKQQGSKSTTSSHKSSDKSSVKNNAWSKGTLVPSNVPVSGPFSLGPSQNASNKTSHSFYSKGFSGSSKSSGGFHRKPISDSPALDPTKSELLSEKGFLKEDFLYDDDIYSYDTSNDLSKMSQSLDKNKINQTENGPLDFPGQCFYYYNDEKKEALINENSFFFIQFPQVFKDFLCLNSKTSNSDRPQAPTSLVKEEDQQTQDQQEQSQSPSEPLEKEKLPTGKLGKMKVYKSGKIELCVGDIIFNVSSGSNCQFLQNFSLIIPERKEILLLGEMNYKLIAHPNLNVLVE